VTRKILSNLKEDAKKKNITNLVIANKIGVSESQVSNWFNSKYKVPFVYFVQMVDIIHNDDEQTFSDYIMKYSIKLTKKESIREACEWFSVNGKHELLRGLLKHLEGNDAVVNLYELFLKRNFREIDPQKFFLAINRIKVDGTETKILRDIGLLYAYLDLKSYKMLFLADEILLDIDDLLSKKNTKKHKRDYSYNAYKFRVKEILAIAEMKKNNVSKSEELANEIIRESHLYPATATSMLSLLAELYVFTNYEKSLNYIYQALEFCEKISFHESNNMKRFIKSTHDFIKIYNHDFDGLFLEDSPEIAHYYAAIGKSEEAIKILNQLERENGVLSPHQLYYKALATKNIDIMESASQAFIDSGDSYYLRMPRSILKEWYALGK